MKKINTYTDILIVGGGPTGLMLACQLARLGIKFRIIEKEPMRTHESKAVGIQSKSMEIFQKLNIADEFLHQRICRWSG
jgi:2-polyprenyl-6-methoxyphenol hydroxylase-like FAD-dependent oxidoreductase